MTVAQTIRCRYCEQVFHLKFQVDTPIMWSKWPIVVECPECNDVMELTFSKKGLSPKIKKAKNDSPGILIGYSGGIPTPASLYYQNVTCSIGFHSVFLVMCQIYGDEVVLRYNYYLKNLQNGIVQWSRVMEEAYQMIRKPKINPTAYYKKLKFIFHDSVSQNDFQKPENCVRHYENMIRCVYDALDFGSFKESPLKEIFYKIICWFISDGDPEKILDIALKTRYNPSLLGSVRMRINTCIKNLSKILPSCFLDFNEGDGNNLFLLTGTIEEINELYADNFEVICKCLPLFMGLYNTVANGDPDCFKRPDDSVAVGNMEKFMSFDNGSKINKMMSLNDIKNALLKILDTQIRNGINHENTEFNIETQVCRYFYDSTRPDNYIECRLIDLAYRVLYQLRFLLMIHKFLLLIDHGKKID